MKSHGFVVGEILEIHRRLTDMALIQVDFLFVREDSPLMADKRQRWFSACTLTLDSHADVHRRWTRNLLTDR